MKKVLVVVLAICCLFLSVGPAWAAGDTAGGDTVSGDGTGVDNSPAEKIEIKFKIGDDTLKINGKDVRVAKPFVSNGATLVPVRVITEAFGAEINWNGSERSITIKYSDVTIKLILDSKEATVNGKTVTMQEAPTVVNGTTMIPLRFITENFGADVGYDKETAQIIVSKEIASSTSIKDFSMILKKTTKTKVGDSYYKWSMSLPKNLKISNRNFNGTFNTFTAVDGTYYIEISLKKLGDETLDSLKSSMLEYVKKYTILDSDVGDSNGQKYVKFVYRDSNYTYEDRKYIDNGRIYTIELYAKDYTTYKNSTEIPALMDSFATSFAKDGKSEDLSDVTASGYRTYKDKKLNWSVDVPADWSDDKNEDKENVISFNSDENDAGIRFKMYSVEKGRTLDTWLEDELKSVGDEYNLNRVKVSKTEDGEINGVKCKKLFVSIDGDQDKYYTCDIYFVGQNYRYNLSYVIDSKIYNDSNEMKKLEGTIASFKFTEPKVDEIGKLVDSDNLLDTTITRKLSNTEYKWSVNLPSAWTEGSNNNGKDLLFYQNSDQSMGVQLVASKEVIDANSFLNAYETKIRDQFIDFKAEKKEVIYDKGVSVYKNTYTFTGEGTALRHIIYSFNKNGFFYTVFFVVSDLRYSEKNKQLLDSIWQSMKFE